MKPSDEEVEREAERLYYSEQEPSALLPWGYACFSWKGISMSATGCEMRAKAKARLLDGAQS
jgi:hypothetical protein